MDIIFQNNINPQPWPNGCVSLILLLDTKYQRCNPAPTNAPPPFFCFEALQLDEPQF